MKGQFFRAGLTQGWLASTMLTAELVGMTRFPSCLPGYQRIYRPYSGWVLSTMSRKSGILERVDSLFFSILIALAAGFCGRGACGILKPRGWPSTVGHPQFTVKGKE
ncbi:MAG: hypothetical protein WA419_19710 [Silvibacterium sp.]